MQEYGKFKSKRIEKYISSKHKPKGDFKANSITRYIKEHFLIRSLFHLKYIVILTLSVFNNRVSKNKANIVRPIRRNRLIYNYN